MIRLVSVLIAAFALTGCRQAEIAFCIVALALLDNEEVKPQPTDTVDVRAVAETEPVADRCDAADDPAVWVNPARADGSFIVVTNKLRGLAVHGVDGATRSQLDAGRMNNVDVRDGIRVGGRETVVVAATNRSNQTIDVFELDPATGELGELLVIPAGFDEEAYGLCLYHSARSGDLYAFANDKDGVVGQWRVVDAAGEALAGSQVRTWPSGVETEGCVADDANGWLFLGAQNDGIWRYDAEPDAGLDKLIVDKTGLGTPGGGRLAGDVEGLTLYTARTGDRADGYLIASSQGNHTYVVYDRAAPHAYRGTFRIVDNGPVDGVSGTDGLDAVAEPLGPDYPLGALVVQDGDNTGADGASENQNFKIVPWHSVAEALALN